jgi:hypothetical protein
MEVYSLMLIKQGSTTNNLKHFIWLTNEYGVPSPGNVDLFIENFGEIILNGNFERVKFSEIDSFWNTLTTLQEGANTNFTNTYNSLFYRILVTEAIPKLQEELGKDIWNKLPEADRLKELKRIILEFNKYISEGMMCKWFI